MHTQRHRYHFWLIGLKNQWSYLIKKQVCLWTHFRQSKCSTTTYPYYPQPPPTPTAPHHPETCINNGIERNTYSHFPSYLININSRFLSNLHNRVLFYKMIKIRGNNPILTLKHNIFLHISLTSTPISFKPS